MTVWPHAYRTPLYVWAASAIAATVLHAGGALWAMAYWQNRRSIVPPPTIEVIAIPAADAIESTVSKTLEQSQSSPMSEATTSDVAVTAPVEPANNTSVSPEPVVPLPTISPAPPTSISETGSSPSPARPQPSPDAETMPQPPTPLPTLEPIPPTPQRDVLTTLMLEPVPVAYRADPPDQFPQMSLGWEETVSTLLQESSCFTGVVPPLVTLQLTVEIDGLISQMNSWGSSDLMSTGLIQCLDALKNKMPPLMPATIDGVPIPTDLMLLTIELNVAR
ncbi:MAG: hypothetical protein F6K42_28410 [Leptolyngbya sp. SIO1D8]|nr:hypothetical protein [Leptolyngbya sp. SIO1D8]